MEPQNDRIDHLVTDTRAIPSIALVYDVGQGRTLESNGIIDEFLVGFRVRNYITTIQACGEICNCCRSYVPSSKCNDCMIHDYRR